jgi:hypothetical protein
VAERILVDTASMSWENGLEVVGKMTPEFGANLGPADQVAEAYVKYNQKTLRIDPATTARADLIHLDPGYADLTDAYHDSVEEAYFIDGDCRLTGEGDFYGGYYFWRPPGWVHSASSKEGFDALLLLEGDSPAEGSGPTSRRIRPGEEAGTNALHEDREKAVGPRGWVRRLDTSLLAWQPGTSFARSEGPLVGADMEHAAFKVLSKNVMTGGQSLLVRLDPGYRQAGPGRHSADLQFFVLSGSLAVGEEQLGQGAYLFSPGGSVEPAMASEEGARLFVKVGGWLDFEPLGG